MTKRSGRLSTGLAWHLGRLRPRRGLLALVAALSLTVTLTAGQGRQEAFATLTIVTEPGATVVLDGRAPIQVGRNGQAVFERVQSGTHMLRVFQQGMRAVERTVTLSPGQTLRVEAPLAPIVGRLEILTTPEALVSVDGEPRGKADERGMLRLSNVRMGERRITAERGGYQKRETTVTVRGDLDLTVTLELTAIALPSVPPRPVSALPAFTVARTIPWPTYESGVSISPDGSWFASCNSDRIAFWEVATGRLRAELEDLTRSRRCEWIAASREHLAAEIGYGAAIIDPGTGKQIRSVPFPTVNGERSSGMSAVVFDDKGTRLAMANWGVRVTVLETTSRRQVWTSNLRPEYDYLGEPLSLAFSPDGRSLAAVGSHVFMVLDAATGAVKADLAQQGVHAEPPAWSPDGRWIVGPADGPVLQLWDVETKLQSYRWGVDQWRLVGCASFSPDGRYLLLGREPDQLGIIDLSTGQGVAEIKSAIGISACAITPDWRVLVTAGDGYLQIWQRK